MEAEEISLISGDPDRNPLLEMTLRAGAPQGWLAALLCLMVVGLAIASFFDVYRGRMTPNWLTHGILVVGAAIAPLAFEDWRTHYIVAGIFLLVFGLFAIIGGVGFGDVKLYVGLALALGLPSIYVLAVAHVLAGLIGAPIAIWKRQRKLALPMFPFVAVGLLVVIPGIGAPAWIALSGAGLLAVAIIVGLLEARFRPVSSLEKLSEPLSEHERVLVRPYQRLQVPDGGEGWAEVPGTRRSSVGVIDLAVHKMLSFDQRDRLDKEGEVRLSPSDHPDLEVLVREMHTGYSLEIRRATAADLQEKAAA